MQSLKSQRRSAREFARTELPLALLSDLLWAAWGVNRADGGRTLVTPEKPLLVMLHGWMDVSASFQFLVDALSSDRRVPA